MNLPVASLPVADPSGDSPTPAALAPEGPGPQAATPANPAHQRKPATEIHLVPLESDSALHEVAKSNAALGIVQRVIRVGAASAPIGPRPGLEVVPGQRRGARLLIQSGPTQRTRINGHPAPGLALAHERDWVQFDDDEAYEVAIYFRPAIAAPTPEQIGVECPVCLTPLESDTRVVTCVCGTAMHWEVPNAKDALLCAEARKQCPTCRRPVILQEGYLHPIGGAA